MGNLFKRISAALVVVVAAFAVNAPLSHTAEAAGGCGGAHSGYTQLSSASFSDGTLVDGALTAGNYYLTEALELDDEIKITENVTVCLNGQSISAESSRVFKIVGSGILTLCNCKTNGAISGEAAGSDYGGAVYVDDNGKLIMEGGTISGSSAKHGAGVYVNNGGTFTMNGGTISGNTANHQGGGVYVNDTGKFELKGGTISGNNVTEPAVADEKETAGGAGVYTAGEFTMSGGSISDNTSKYYGGGVLVSGSKAEFTLENGTLSGNKAETYGGGVHVSRSGTVIMNGGTIQHNEATNGGGGVSMGGGEFTMKGGLISVNKAKYGGGVRLSDNSAKFTLEKGSLSNNEATDGGGLYLSGGTFEVSSNGKLSNNSAANNGGGVFLDKGALNMSGGEIAGNTAKLGSCVYMDNKSSGGGTMTLSNAVTITSNTSSNVYLADGKTITIGKNFSATSPIGIHPEKQPTTCQDAIVPATTFAADATKTNISKHFRADKNPKIIVYEEEQIKLKGAHNYDSENWVNTDPDTHWHICTLCGNEVDKAAHRWDSGKITKQPTLTEAGEILYTCLDCKYEKTEPLQYKAPSTTGGSNRTPDKDEDNSVTPVSQNPPTGIELAFAPAALTLALIAASTRKRR